MSDKQEGEVVLVVSDNPGLRTPLDNQLQLRGYRSAMLPVGADIVEALAASKAVVAIIDLGTAIPRGPALIRTIRNYDPTIQCIAFATLTSIETAVQAIREQVYDYITEPFNMTDLMRVVGHAVEHATLLRDKRDADTMLAHRSEELAASLQALNESQDRLVRTANAALMGQLAEGLRHELGNALTVIRLNMNLIHTYRDDQDRFAWHMNSLEQGVRAIERIAFALRSFPTVRSDDAEPLDLAQIIRQAANQAEQTFANQVGQLITFNLDEPTPIRGSFFQLMRTFVGIIENAIEAASGANPEAPEVWITLAADGENWKVTVRDNGPGFLTEALDHGTEPGYTTKVDRGFMRGLGLGLFVATSVLDKHGGKLRLFNLPHGGAQVEAWLPRDGSLNPTD